MAYYRRFEIAADIAYKNREIRGLDNFWKIGIYLLKPNFSFCHLYDGQEAICTGMEVNYHSSDKS